MQAEQTFETVRSALGRWLSPLVAWIPDVTAFPHKRQVAIGVIASILFHVLLISFFVVHELVWPVRVQPMPPPVPTAPLRVVVMPKPHFHDEDPLVKARRQLLDAKGLDASTEKPDDAQFESDKDMKAGSELPATGILPLPSQQGRTDLPGHDFRDQEVRLGVVPDPTPETLRPPDPSAEGDGLGAPCAGAAFHPAAAAAGRARLRGQVQARRRSARAREGREGHPSAAQDGRQAGDQHRDADGDAEARAAGDPGPAGARSRTCRDGAEIAERSLPREHAQDRRGGEYRRPRARTG